MKFFLVALIAAASQLVYAQGVPAPKTILIQVGNPTAPTDPQKLQFNPRVVSVNPGDTVMYQSNGVHRVREQANFTLCSPLAGSTFDSGPLVKGSTWQVPPELLVPGKTIIYYCPEGQGKHCASPNNMQGALVVKGGAADAAGGAAGGAAPGGSTAPKTITVEVGKGGLKFVPDSVSASPGDTVMFTWVSGNHNIIPSDAPASCVKSTKADTDPLMKALASGAPQTTGQHLFQVPATAQVGQTLNYYCGVATHCSAGKMYASINIVAPGTAAPAPGAAAGAAGAAAPGTAAADGAAPVAASASTLAVSTSTVTFAVVVASLMF